MLYLLIIPVIVVLILGYNQYRKAEQQKSALQSIINSWGEPADNYRDIERIKGYHNYLKNENSISDAIATDIDLENVFNYCDRTNSKVGQQYLYHQLRSPGADVNKLQQLDQLTETLCADEQTRAQIQLELWRLNNKNAYYLHELFSSEHLPLYNWALALYIRLAAFLWIAVLILTIKFHLQPLLLLALGLTFFNFYIHYSNKKNVLKYVHSLPQLYSLLHVARHISNKVDIPQNADIQTSLKNAGSLGKSLRFVNMEDRLSSNDPTDLIYAFWELIKTFLLIEPAMFIASIDKVSKYRDDIENLFNYVGQIDTAISVGSIRLSLPYFSKPNFIADDDTLSVNGLYHPLVENCVANSLDTFDHQGVLITGSNMSGKTTFIRALAVNALLSQTLYTSCTQQYKAPLLQLFTSIRISDDMEEHKSYFQSEAISVLNIMKQSKANPLKSLVIIDEIFRGTNTIERVAAAKAILSYFTVNKSFVFVSTHDLELAELLGEEYAVYCFEEQVADTRLVFDYKIKPGILKNKNAIAIMAGLGYPETVINDAYAMSERLREKYKG